MFRILAQHRKIREFVQWLAIKGMDIVQAYADENLSTEHNKEIDRLAGWAFYKLDWIMQYCTRAMLAGGK